MRVEENIIVSMTSWHKRITNVKLVLETLLKQTVPPTRIILSLCIQNFPRMTKDLPEDLLEFLDEHKGLIELFWFLEDYKAWKKHLHALDVAGDDDLIICTDDDHLYPEYFIENLYVSYLFYGKKYPVTNNIISLTHDIWCFNGPGTLYKKKHWGDYQKFLTYDVLHYVWEDTILSTIFMSNKHIILPQIFHISDDVTCLYSSISAYTDVRYMTESEQAECKIRRDLSTKKIVECIDQYYCTNSYKNITNATPNLWDLLITKTFQMEDDIKKSGEHIPLPMQFIFDIYHNHEQNLPGLRGLTNEDYKSINIDVERFYRKEDLIGENNRVIITIASWNKRIQNVATVLKNVLYNTMPPDLIVINLARPDFNVQPGKIPTMLELSSILPDDLFDMLITYPEIQIHWYDDATIKSWKKHLYVMNEFNDNDVIICIDDDKIYSQVFIETMLKSYNFYDRKFPVTMCTENYLYGTFAVHGSCTLYTPGFLRGYSKYISTVNINEFSDNDLLSYLFIMLGRLVLPAIGRNYTMLDKNFNYTDISFNDNSSDNVLTKNSQELHDEFDLMINDTAKFRPELNNGWTPQIFNFSYELTKKFLEDYKNSDKKYPFDLIYNSIKDHFESGDFGKSSSSGLDDKIDWYII